MLKNIRDRDTAAHRQNQSYKIDESRLKRLRQSIGNFYGISDWREFCDQYVGSMLVNEWAMIEEDLGLGFVEIMEGVISDLFHSPLRWADMVQLMGENGLRGQDAMILNLFSKSKFPVLVTTDSGFEACMSGAIGTTGVGKAIFLLR